MPPSNWCKLHSQAVHSDVFQDAELWRFWCYILMRTSRNGNDVLMNGHMFRLTSGQCVIGRKQAAHDCYTTEQRIRTMIKNLKNMKNITTESTNRCTVVTVCNWDSYQSSKPDNQPAEQPTTNQQLTNKQPAANHNLEAKRDKKLRGTENEISDEAKRLATNLLKITEETTGRKLVAKPSGSYKPIQALLNDGVSVLAIELTTKWLITENLKREYPFSVQSGTALRKKWDDIQAAMSKPNNRDKTGKQSDATKPKVWRQ